MTKPKTTGWDSLHGPWTSKGDVWGDGSSSWTRTVEELRALHAAMPDEAAIKVALGVKTPTARKADRALQLLRKAGLATYDKATRT